MPLRSVEAATRDDAIAAAREQFGPTARVVGVRRVRSGGVLGFFATERYVAEVDPDHYLTPRGGAVPSGAASSAAVSSGPAAAWAPTAGTPSAGHDGAGARWDAQPRRRTALQGLADEAAGGPGSTPALDPVSELAGLLGHAVAAPSPGTYTRTALVGAAPSPAPAPAPREFSWADFIASSEPARPEPSRADVRWSRASTEDSPAPERPAPKAAAARGASPTSAARRPASPPASQEAARGEERPAARVRAGAVRTSPAPWTFAGLSGQPDRADDERDRAEDGRDAPGDGESPPPSPFTAALARMVAGDRDVRKAVQEALDERAAEQELGNQAGSLRAWPAATAATSTTTGAAHSVDAGALHQEEEPVTEQEDMSPDVATPVAPVDVPSWGAAPEQAMTSSREEVIAEVLREALAQGHSDETLASILRRVLAGESPETALRIEPAPPLEDAAVQPAPAAAPAAEEEPWGAVASPLWGEPSTGPRGADVDVADAPIWAEVVSAEPMAALAPVAAETPVDAPAPVASPASIAFPAPVAAEVPPAPLAPLVSDAPVTLPAPVAAEIPLPPPAPVAVEAPVAPAPAEHPVHATAAQFPVVATAEGLAQEHPAAAPTPALVPAAPAAAVTIPVPAAPAVAEVAAEKLREAAAEAATEDAAEAARARMQVQLAGTAGLARTASDPAPLPLDATAILPPLSLLPPLASGRRSGLPPVPPSSGRPPVPPAKRPSAAAQQPAAEPAEPAAEEENGRTLATVVRLPVAPVFDALDEALHQAEPTEDTAEEPAAVPEAPEPPTAGSSAARPEPIPAQPEVDRRGAVPAEDAPAAAPARPAPGDLVGHLRALGVPELILGPAFTAEAEAHGVYAALTRALSAGLPAAPELPNAAGEALFVVGPGVETLRAARALAASMRLGPERVQWATRGELAALAPKGSRMTTIDQAIDRRQEATSAGTLTIVAVDAPLRTDAYWIAQMLAVWTPVAVWAVVDATRKPEDVEPWLDGLPRVDALMVQDTDLSADPAAVLDRIAVPVALVDGVPATPHRWASLLCERLEKHRG